MLEINRESPRAGEDDGVGLIGSIVKVRNIRRQRLGQRGLTSEAAGQVTAQPQD